MIDLREHQIMDNYKDKIFELNLKTKPIFDKNDHVKYINDWRGQYIGNALAILKPNDANEISKILKFANSNQISIVPQGGNTSLCGGATPLKNSRSLIISTEKMDKILSIDKKSMTMTVEPGVILSVIHEKAEENNLFFPLSLGAKGSCTIGGNLSTNAGGINVLKYGNARELCLGLEIILPNGEKMNLLKNLKKDNTGYDLKNMFIGAEGTLGLISAATIKLFPKQKLNISAFVEALSIKNAISLLNLFQNELANELEAFELMPKVFWEIASNNIENISIPFNKIPQMGVLLELATTSTNDSSLNKNGSTNLNEKLENLLSKAFDYGLIEDAIICKNENEKNALWEIRERAAESEKKELEKSNSIKCLKHDISLPVHNIDEFHKETQKMISSKLQNTKTIFFGHLGDGNLHYNIFGNGNGSDGFENLSKEITINLYKIVNKLNGSISAEHGIGQLKKQDLKDFKDPTAYNLMKNLKKMIDPNNIMNPGKILI